MQGTILVVDDELAICTMLVREFRNCGLECQYATNPETGLELLKSQNFDLVITDLRMPGMDGLEFLSRAKRIRPTCEIVMITAYATVATAREALKRGAVDYLTKPFSVADELRPLVRRVLEERTLDAIEPVAVATATEPTPPSPDRAIDSVVASGKSMRRVVERARRVAASEASVLLQGESGTGKEVIANLIHSLSPRRDKPFVKINCAALPEGLLESEFFGYAKGAFTGAAGSRIGLFQVAHGGTLMLDEIGELSMSFQPKLLRVLQEGEFHRIGDSLRPVTVDVRIIAATNRDLKAAMEAGMFRSDLYYRLNVVPIELPPLREHIEDLGPLVDHFTKLLGKGRKLDFNDEALELLKCYPWPGNTRELANAVEYALVMSEGPQACIDDLPVAIQDYSQMHNDSSIASGDASNTLEAIEKRSILQAMEKQEFNRTRAARLLGVTRRTLGYRIAKYGLGDELEQRSLQPPSPKRAAMARTRPAPHLSPGFSRGHGLSGEN
ncbi:MAG: sigma-54-dependent Fis family transcriptional regulator [Myxococcales bacterium]|nr:sigma-54-dependent Fis family transcriptional regulator [Myxococcales bacterium]